MLGTAAAALTLTFGFAASAEEGPEIDYNRLGGYFQLGGVYSWDNYSGGYDSEGAGGLDFRLGNRFHQFVAVEFQYEFVSQRTVVPTTPIAMAQLVVPFTTIYTHQVTFNSRTYPWSSKEAGFFHEILGGRLQPYALTGIGVGIWSTPNGDGVGFVARLGVGMDFYATEHVVVTVESTYDFSAGGNPAETTNNVTGGFLPIDKLDQISLAAGVAYRF
jgi:opacity protein-like surface antigen